MICSLCNTHWEWRKSRRRHVYEMWTHLFRHFDEYTRPTAHAHSLIVHKTFNLYFVLTFLFVQSFMQWTLMWLAVAMLMWSNLSLARKWKPKIDWSKRLVRARGNRFYFFHRFWSLVTHIYSHCPRLWATNEFSEIGSPNSKIVVPAHSRMLTSANRAIDVWLMGANSSKLTGNWVSNKARRCFSLNCRWQWSEFGG